MRMAQGFIVALCLGVYIVGCSASETSNQPTELKLENLLQQSLDEAFTPGREVIVSYVEIPPHTTMDRHWHPGEEFHYYLEGEAEIVIEGGLSIIARPGAVGHIPFQKMHTAITGETGAKVIVFRVHTEGEPVRYVEDGGASEQ